MLHSLRGGARLEAIGALYWVAHSPGRGFCFHVVGVLYFDLLFIDRVSSGWVGLDWIGLG